MNEPLVSIVMSAYNAEKYLEEAILSILCQTYDYFEFIIIDDGSNDESLNIINRYRAKDNRILLISRENKGLVYSLNEGIKLAKGKYIARMDADDISLPNRLLEQVKFMEDHPKIGVCGTFIETFGDGIKPSKWKLSCTDKRLKAELLFSSCFVHPSVMIRRSLLIENNVFYEDQYLHAEDFAMWVKLSDLTCFSNLDKCLFKYRVLNSSATRKADSDIVNRYIVINSIVSKNLLKLELGNNGDENKLHFDLYVNSRIKSANLQFVDLNNYFNKIINNNKKNSVFDEYELKMVLGKKWLWNFLYKPEFKAVFSSFFIYGVLAYMKKFFLIFSKPIARSYESRYWFKG